MSIIKRNALRRGPAKTGDVELAATPEEGSFAVGAVTDRIGDSLNNVNGTALIPRPMLPRAKR